MMNERARPARRAAGDMVSRLGSPAGAAVACALMAVLAVLAAAPAWAQADGDPFITTWTTTATNQAVTIPVGGHTGNYTVDWGDGSAPTTHAADATHRYATPGTHTISITGDFGRFYLPGGGEDNAARLTSIEQWGDVPWTSMEEAFRGAANLVYNATDAPDLSGAASTVDMFRGASSFNGDLSSWDVSQVTDMSRMFLGASSFDRDLSAWNVSSVTDMSRMFRAASSFNGDLSSWDVSRVTNMAGMFYGASSFNGDLSSWDVGRVTNMALMFLDAASFNGDISGWDVSGATYMTLMLWYADSFEQNLGAWYVVPVDHTYDLSEAPSLSVTAISAQNAFLDGQNPTYGIGAGHNGTLFNVIHGSALAFRETPDPGSYTVNVTASVPVVAAGNSWKVLDVEVTGQFVPPDLPEGAFVTTWTTTVPNQTITIPVGGHHGNYTVHWGDGSEPTAHAADATHRYATPGTYTVSITGDFGRFLLVGGGAANGAALTSIEQWGNASWTSMGSAFAGAENMVYNAADSPDLSGVTDTGRMFAHAAKFDGDLSSWNVSQVTDMNSMFINAAAFDGDLSSWNVSQVTDMRIMFYGASSFNRDISSWNVDRVTNMAGMLWDASSFNRDISSWNVGRVTNMAGMFGHAAKFDGDISGWNTGNVGDMHSMFWGASSFNQDISSWNVGRVTDMHNMFYGASSFNRDVSSWDVSGATNMDSMFDEATAFEQNLGTWYVVPEDTAYDLSEAPSLNITTISARNAFLDWQNPTYGTGAGHDSGLFNMTGSALMFRDTPGPGSYTVNVTASGDTVFGDGNNWLLLDIGVTGQDRTAPVIAINGSDRVTVALGSTYSDGGATCWDETDGNLPVNSTGTVDTATAGEYTITYSCTDSGGNDALPVTRTVTVAAAEPPSREITGLSLNSTAPGAIHVTWNGLDGEIRDYRVSWAKVGDSYLTWTDHTGNAFPTNSSHTITDLEEGAEYKVIVRARYQGGPPGPWSGELTVTVAAAPANRPPVADAGPDQNDISEGQTVTLDGSSSADPDPGDTLAYLWTQTSGTAVTLSNSTDPSPTFAAPAGPDTLVFRLAVTDRHGASATDTVTVHVAAPPSREISGLSLNSTTPGTIQVTWDGLEGDIRDYRVSWAKVGDSYLTWTDHTGNAFPAGPSHDITNLEEGETYKVIVRARYQDGPPGPWSGELTITVARSGSS